MPFSRIPIDKRSRTYARLIGSIRHALNQALGEEHERRGLTQAEMARILGRDRSFVSRKLAGTSNMTLETLADLAYALDRPVRIELPPRTAAKPTVVKLSSYRQLENGKVVDFPTTCANPERNSETVTELHQGSTSLRRRYAR